MTCKRFGTNFCEFWHVKFRFFLIFLSIWTQNKGNVSNNIIWMLIIHVSTRTIFTQYYFNLITMKNRCFSFFLLSLINLYERKLTLHSIPLSFHPAITWSQLILTPCFRCVFLGRSRSLCDSVQSFVLFCFTYDSNLDRFPRSVSFRLNRSSIIVFSFHFSE